MSAAIIARAIAKGLTWLAGRGKTVSKHISHHTRSAANAAARNPRYAARVTGQTAHSIFRDPRPRKLVEQALKSPDKTLLQRNGRVVVEKQFNRAIGKGDERIIRIILDSRTGRIVTAFPVRTFLTAAGLIAIPQNALSAVFDENLVETLDGVEKMAAEWSKRPKPDEGILIQIIDFLLDVQPAGDPNEELLVKVHQYVTRQAHKMIRELETDLGEPISDETRQSLIQQFRAAVAGAVPNPDDEW